MANRRSLVCRRSATDTRYARNIISAGSLLCEFFSLTLYAPQTAAENIAYGQSSPMQVMGSWMTSPGHKANILNPALKELGVGLSSSGFRWTQGFGAPQSGCGNGFKEGSETCDTGEAKEANCVNCRLAAGATCSPRTELDGGDQCGSDRVTEQITVTNTRFVSKIASLFLIVVQCS
jgi:hypothetical protein